MPLEQLSNNAASTTTGAVDGVTNPVAVTVASASAFPSAGNFRIIIDSEILLVTAVAGAVFTCSRGQEGTAINSHLSGAAVTHIITSASLKQIVSEFHLADTHALRPAAAQAGRVFFPTDGGQIFRDTGTVWQCWPHGFGPMEPPLADFTTWLQQGTATFTTPGNVGLLSIAGAASAENVRSRLKSLAAFPTTWKMTLVYAKVVAPGQTGNQGIILRNSTNGRLWGHSTTHTQINAYGYQWSSPTVYSGVNTHTDSMGSFVGPLVMVRLRYDGTLVYFEHSIDFVTWTVNRSYNLAASYLAGADEIGFYLNANNLRAGQTAGIVVYHAKLEA